MTNHRFNLRLKLSAAAVLLALSGSPARAQGIPVMDLANLLQTILQVLNDITEIQNQVQQITQLQDQLSSINGMRNLGDVLNNSLLHNYVPPAVYNLMNDVDAKGYSGLISSARSLRDAGMVYNCLDLKGSERTYCQANLARPYQHKGLLEDAMAKATKRLNQINGLMQQVNATTDAKAIEEVQARIGAENALLAHETSQIQMLQGMADSEERIAQSRERERQYQMITRTGRIANFLP